MIRWVDLRSIGAFVLYVLVYTFVTYYAYIVINDAIPRRAYLMVTFLVMAMPLYLLGLVLVKLIKPYLPAATALMFGVLGFGSLLIIKPDDYVVLYGTYAPQSAPYIINNFNHMLAIISSFCLGMFARQVFWLITENIRALFREPD